MTGSTQARPRKRGASNIVGDSLASLVDEKSAKRTKSSNNRKAVNMVEDTSGRQASLSNWFRKHN
jgi:hypothetical protein